VESLLTVPYKPRDEDEKVIQMKFDKFIRSVSGFKHLNIIVIIYKIYIYIFFSLHLQVMVDKIFIFDDVLSYEYNNKICGKNDTKSIALFSMDTI